MKWILSSIILILYACSIMYMLLDVHFFELSRKRKLCSSLFFIAFLIINIAAQTLLGYQLYAKYYLLFTQLPVYFLFLILSQYRGIKLFFVLLTAIFFSSPVMVLISIARYFFIPPLWVHLLCYVILCRLIHRFFKKSFNYMLAYAENSMFVLFITIPLLYYVYNYSLTQYQLPDIVINKFFFIQQIPLLIVLISYILLAQIFKMISEKAELKNAQNLASAQLNAATKQIEQLKAAEKQTSIYRHDLRHHMNYLNACICENNLQDALAYIQQTCEDINNMKLEQYSQNKSVDLIISSYVNRAKEKEIAIEVNISATDFSRFQITNLCSLLANSLENAILACEQIENNKGRFIKLRMYEKSNKLCLDIRNSYTAEPIFEHGIPISHKNGHGIGVKSIIHVIEKYKGVYRFSVKNGMFIFQVSM